MPPTAASAPVRFLQQFTATRAPCRAIASAVARPIPLEAPVINATWPLNDIMPSVRFSGSELTSFPDAGQGMAGLQTPLAPSPPASGFKSGFPGPLGRKGARPETDA